ncbi:MAG: putative sulfate exporter family transporter, partial [Jatrophihabitantaceae bacterium]
LSIAVLIPAAAWLARRHADEDSDEPHTAARAQPLVPLFVAAFVGFIVLRTGGDALFGSGTLLWQRLVGSGYEASDLFLTCGMTAVGLSVSFTDMWRIGWRPLAAGFVVATLVGGCSLLLTSGMLHFFP